LLTDVGGGSFRVTSDGRFLLKRKKGAVREVIFWAAFLFV